MCVRIVTRRGFTTRPVEARFLPVFGPETAYLSANLPEAGSALAATERPDKRETEDLLD